MGSPLRLKYPLTKRDTTIRDVARNETFEVKSSSMPNRKTVGGSGGTTWDLV